MRDGHIVARIERSEIRGGHCSPTVHPGFHFVQSGLRSYEAKKHKEAERRQTQGLMSRTQRRAGRATEVSGLRRPSAVGRARLPAFHHGSRQRDSSSQRLSVRPGFLGRGLTHDLKTSCASKTRLRVLPAFACPSPGKHLPSRSSCRETDARAARERTANPPAGTALAPMTRCASRPRPYGRDSMAAYVTETGTKVKQLSRSQ